MQKIVLLAVNSRFTHSNPALLYLKKISVGLPYTVEVVEYNLKTDIFEILNTLLIKKPDYLGFSVYIWNDEYIERLIYLSKSILPQTVIFLGGPEVSCQPERWLNTFPFVNFIICGEGEEGFLWLLKKKFLENQKIIKSKHIPLEQLPFIYDEENILDFKNKYVYYESSRGCPFRCSFCLSSRNSQKAEYRSLTKVFSELDFLIENNLKIVKFVDRTFNSLKKHTREIWKYIIKKNESTKFHFEINPILLEEEDLNILKSVPKNFFQLEIGVQSLNKDTLIAVNRECDIEELENKLKFLTSLENVHLHLDLIVGLPHDELKCFRDSFNKICLLKPDYLQIGFLKILTGTEIYDRLEEYQIVYDKKSPYHIISNKWLSASEVIFLKHFSYVFHNIYNCGNFKSTNSALTSLYLDPFTFYEKMTEFWLKKLINFNLRDWLKISEIFLEFVREYHPEKEAFVKECLLLDWCINNNTNFIPENIAIKNYKTLKESFKNDFFLFTSDLIKGNLIEHYKKTFIFSPQTVDFLKFFNPEYKAIAFLTVKNEKRMFYLPG